MQVLNKKNVFEVVCYHSRLNLSYNNNFISVENRMIRTKILLLITYIFSFLLFLSGDFTTGELHKSSDYK